MSCETNIRDATAPLTCIAAFDRGGALVDQCAHEIAGHQDPDSRKVSSRVAAGGSSAAGRPCDVGPRCERWRALDGERDAAFDAPSTNLPVEVLTRSPGETRRRISSGGGVAVVVSRDARLSS